MALRDEVLDLLRGGDRLGAVALCRQVNRGRDPEVDRKAVSRALRWLVRAGLVECTGRTRARKYWCGPGTQERKAFEFKMESGELGWVTQEMFDAKLHEILADMPASRLLSVPQIYKTLADHYNNSILARLQQSREENGEKE